MISPAGRIALYVGGCGAVLAWLGPEDGVVRALLTVALIVLSAYLDSFLSAWGGIGKGNGKVVSLGAFRAQRLSRSAGPGGGRRTRALHLVFDSPRAGEAEGLNRMLRTGGVRSRIVVQPQAREKGFPVYQVLVPEADLAEARPLTDRFLARATKKPS